MAQPLTTPDPTPLRLPAPAPRRRRRILRVLLLFVVVLLLVLGAGALWVRSEVRASLPRLDGELKLAGLSAPVTVERDALGVPTIRAATRVDAARALGFLHGQDRFFQMDLLRRNAAGELAALFGSAALDVDKQNRVHRFRHIAGSVLARATPEERAVFTAYAAGVNAGLAALGAKPWEYLVLRTEPVPWAPEDTVLAVDAMFLDLQGGDGGYESQLGLVHDLLPPPLADFLTTAGTEWDAPIVGTPRPTPPIPGPEVFDLRKEPPVDLPKAAAAGPSPLLREDAPESPVLGSNNWAVSGAHTADGGALLADDMHLGIRVPNTWYRAAFEWSDRSNPSEPHRLFGVSLPGVPAMVVGSNTHVAWGFTNTYADWNDIVLLDTDPSQPNRYKTPDGWREFERFSENFQIAGQPDERQDVWWTIWGPVLEPDYRGRLRALRWVAHAADRLAASVVPFETDRTIEEAFDTANGLGTPGQNIVAADRSGRIGWSVYGAIPRRVGIDGQLPASWADGARGWDGWLNDAEYPRIIDPPGGRIWTANARVVDGEMLATLGDAGYEIGARAHIIRDRLAARERFTARDLLAIQLDTRADFLSRWRDLLVKTLTPDAIAGHPQRASLTDIIEHRWIGEAAPGSAAYRFTRAFRDTVSEHVMGFVLSECYEADRTFDYTAIRRREASIWKLVTEQPQHLLDPQYGSWRALLLAAVDATIEQATRQGSDDLGTHTWAEYNVVAYRHPLSAAIPFAGRWLDMPRVPLPGDLYTPRVQWGNIGASERMIVSPGREAEGIMQMPTGQSGHPLSPFYANSHAAWVNGDASSFLPGQALHI